MKHVLTCTLFVAAALLAGIVSAADVDARLSAREAYVGMPITLQITISDASDYQQPTIPQIDGCDIRSAGTPSQSSQITIINGRRSETRSVTMQYMITPRREGSFEIPSLKIEVDGKTTTTQPQRFIATKSVTGDLLFVEIEGGKDEVFVGQPLDLTLKIWVKPYRDAERNMTLSEGDMWQMVAEQTSWGGFTARMKELAENNQRPSGSEVLRDDGQGNRAVTTCTKSRPRSIPSGLAKSTRKTCRSLSTTRPPSASLGLRLEASSRTVRLAAVRHCRE